MFKISDRTCSLIRQALAEDIGRRDATTDLLIPKDLRGEATISVKAGGILCGGVVVSETFRLFDSNLRVRRIVDDGKQVSRGKKVSLIYGRVASILKAERVALNFLGHLSGVASLTGQFVRKVKGTRAKIFDTRKTTPLWRELEKYAVRCGGGQNHRFGLWDEILVKDNHWHAIRKLLEQTHCDYFVEKLRYGKRLGKRSSVEIEVQSLKELSHLLEGDFRPDVILLDNFSVSDLKRAVRMVRGRQCLEASGGVTLANVRQIAQAGVDRISVGALTHSASALDVSLKITKVF